LTKNTVKSQDNGKQYVQYTHLHEYNCT